MSKLLRKHKIDLIEHLSDKEVTQVQSYPENKSIKVVIKYPAHELQFIYKRDIFRDIYYDLPAFLVKKYLDTEGIKSFINY